MDELGLGKHSKESTATLAAAGGGGCWLLPMSREEIRWRREWIWSWGIERWGTGENHDYGVSINGRWHAAVIGRWWKGDQWGIEWIWG